MTPSAAPHLTRPISLRPCRSDDCSPPPLVSHQERSPGPGRGMGSSDIRSGFFFLARASSRDRRKGAELTRCRWTLRKRVGEIMVVSRAGYGEAELVMEVHG